MMVTHTTPLAGVRPHRKIQTGLTSIVFSARNVMTLRWDSAWFRP